jgi:hypothetical protein
MLSTLEVQAMKEHGGLRGSGHRSIIPYVHGKMRVIILLCVVLI